MPRLSNTLPKYRKHRASGQAFVELNGHRHYLGPHGTKVSRLGYDQKVAEWLASGRASTYGTPASDVTVVELVASYLVLTAGDLTCDEFGVLTLQTHLARRPPCFVLLLIRFAIVSDKLANVATSFLPR